MNKIIIVISMISIFITLIIFVNNEETSPINNNEEQIETITQEPILKQVSNSSICKDLNMRVYNETYCYNT